MKLFQSFPRLETKNLILRELSYEDANDIYELAKNPNVSRYVSWDCHDSIDQTKAFLDWSFAEYKKGEIFSFSIIQKETNKLMGLIGGVDVKLDEKTMEIGYWVGEEYWGKGYTTEAAKALIEYCFKEMGMETIYARHFVDNPGSGKVMVKAGMVFQGIDKKSEYIKEKYWDVAQYKIEKDEAR